LGYVLHQGDCLQVMATLEANSVDTIVTDPPYGLSFMGKHWDHGVPGVAFWAAALRVAKPGAMLIAFGGTRTFHRLTCAIEDAGWEVRDVVSWLYGQGFPKSADISKLIDKRAGAEREVVGEYSDNGRKVPKHQNTHAAWEGDALVQITAPATPDAQTWHGWGTALKPAWEPVIMAMKPLDGTYADNALRWGVAGLNVDGARIGGAAWSRPGGEHAGRASGIMGETVPREPSQSNPAGRWPANLILDEAAAAALDVASGELTSGGGNKSRRGDTAHTAVFGTYNAPLPDVREVDTGGASRFFYVAKASRRERNAGLEGMEARAVEADDHNLLASTFRTDPRSPNGGYVNKPAPPQVNHHPTVKPLALMQYLVRLTATPFGGVVLDPFMGSGTTGVACILEGRSFVGIEREAEYLEIARRRIDAATLPLMREAAD
jgi:DNA modification methylase